MSFKNSLKAAYVVISGVSLFLVFTVMMSATAGAQAQETTGTTSSTTVQWDLSTFTSLITIASVLIAVGIFIQQSRNQNEKIGELKELIETSNQNSQDRLRECRIDCEKHRTGTSSHVTEVKSDIVRQISIIHEDFKNSLERMWLKYEKLEQDMVDLRLKEAQR